MEGREEGVGSMEILRRVGMGMRKRLWKESGGVMGKGIGKKGNGFGKEKGDAELCGKSRHQRLVVDK